MDVLHYIGHGIVYIKPSFDYVSYTQTITENL